MRYFLFTTHDPPNLYTFRSSRQQRPLTRVAAGGGRGATVADRSLSRVDGWNRHGMPVVLFVRVPLEHL